MLRLINHLNMTMAVDWDVKPQTKQGFLNYYIFLSQNVDFLILASSGNPDEMQHYSTFHLSLHCLPKYLFRDFQYTKGRLCVYTFICRSTCINNCLIYFQIKVLLQQTIFPRFEGLSQETLNSFNCK